MPASERSLIIHCDDLGLSSSVNRATFTAFESKLITSASVIMVSSAVQDVAQYASQNPDADLGVHLTLTSEWSRERWKPLCSACDVPSLVDEEGHLWSSVETFTANARGDEIERELHAQIDAAYALGLRPTHVDCHMFALFASFPALEAYANVARRRQLPFLSAKDNSSSLQSVLRDTDRVLDAVRIASPSWRSECWLLHYLSILTGIEDGITQLIVHLGYDEPDLQEVVGRDSEWGSAWRQRDFDPLCRPEWVDRLRKRNVRLIGWKEVASLHSTASV